jgi:peptide subunit release factor 1 (eRF1)
VTASPRTLSVYLETSPARMNGRAYPLRLRDHCRAIRLGGADDDQDAFEDARALVEAYLVDQLEPGPVVWVVRGERSRRYPGHSVAGAANRPRRLCRRSLIAPLEVLLDEHERLAIALFDAERARLFTVFLGAIEGQQQVADYVPAKQAAGGAFGPGRHREDHLRRHAERTARTLMGILRERSFDRLVLVGPDEALAVLRRELPRPLQARLAGTLASSLFASDADVLDAGARANEAIERQTGQHDVAELLEAAGTSHVALGLTDALNAVAELRVHQLLIADQLEAHVTLCPTCNRPASDEHRCPACGREGRAVVSSFDAIIEHALTQATKIETVSGMAAVRLQEHGGIGAWTRF